MEWFDVMAASLRNRTHLHRWSEWLWKSSSSMAIIKIQLLDEFNMLNSSLSHVGYVAHIVCMKLCSVFFSFRVEECDMNVPNFAD